MRVRVRCGCCRQRVNYPLTRHLRPPRAPNLPLVPLCHDSGKPLGCDSGHVLVQHGTSRDGSGCLLQDGPGPFCCASGHCRLVRCVTCVTDTAARNHLRSLDPTSTAAQMWLFWFSLMQVRLQRAHPLRVRSACARAWEARALLSMVCLTRVDDLLFSNVFLPSRSPLPLFRCSCRSSR